MQQNYSRVMAKSKIAKEDGFIAIIALSIFLLLSLFGIIVQKVTIDSLQNVATTNKYNEASDIADSVIEYLQYEMSQREAGFSLPEELCVYNLDGSQTGDPRICEKVDIPLSISGKDMEITMEVKGRNDALNEKDYLTGYPQTGQKTFVIPHLGTGNAGSNCTVYQSEIESSNWSSVADAPINDKGQIDTTANIWISQIDYSCNWNKLSFGSSSTDRVAIPLYYDESDTSSMQPMIVNPFLDLVTDPNKSVNQLIIRIRPPCKPCTAAVCPEDVTMCSTDPADHERYFLDDGGGNSDENDIVVQWQISGMCDGEQCSFIPYVDQPNNYINDSTSSAITEGEINSRYFRDYRVVSFSEDSTVSTSDYNNYLILNLYGTPKILNELIEKPTLILFLNEKLISENDENVPYLEYQILTDNPIGSPNTQAVTTINIGGYVFEKTLNKQEQTSLIDFAVQN